MSEMHSAQPGPLRVLVVEDNQDFAQILRDILEIKGCETAVAFNARAGLETTKKIMPDMIFCDIGLPGDINGLGFARALRADSELAHIPLIAVSGYNSDEDRQRASLAGFDMIFPKPVRFADITQALAIFSKRKTG
jgi:CheY-like chemotaxis protein